MRFEVEVTPEDFKKMTYYINWYAPEQKNARIIFKISFALLILPFFILSLFLIIPEYMKNNTLITVLYFSVIIFVLSILIARSAKFIDLDSAVMKLTKASRLSKLNEKIIYNFVDDFFGYKTENSEGRVYYKGLDRIIETIEHYFIYSNYYNVLIIPKSSFKTPTEETEFKKIVERIQKEFLN